MKTTVVNVNNEKWDVYIGRPSKWGNPFWIDKKHSREDVVNLYREWINNQPHLLEALHELKGKRLGCFCKPEICHGDVLAELADKKR